MVMGMCVELCQQAGHVAGDRAYSTWSREWEFTGLCPLLLTIVQHATKSELLPLTFLFPRRERIRVTFQMEERGLTHCDDPIQKEVYPEGARGL